MSVRGIAAAAALLSLAAGSASAQRRGYGYQQYFGSPDEMYQPPDFHGNPPYDGRYVFARVRYKGYEHWVGREGPGWSHDYPDAEENLMKIIRDITNVNPFVAAGPIVGSALVAIDDPALFKYPVSYMSEPGGWEPADQDLVTLRSYLLKGGFLIFDDFREAWRGDYDWTHLQQIFAKMMPGARWVQLTGKEPIFHSFFDIDLPKTVNPTSAYGTRPPTFWAIYEDNDPAKRIMVMADVDNDIGESWQWAPQGFIPVDSKNETFKLGVNYIIYALTH